MTPTTQSMQDAAPEMYAALQELIEYVDEMPDFHDPEEHEQYAALVTAKMAIDKADGKPDPYEMFNRPEPIRVPGNEVTIDIARQEEMNDYSARGGNE